VQKYERFEPRSCFACTDRTDVRFAFNVAVCLNMELFVKRLQKLTGRDLFDRCLLAGRIDLVSYAAIGGAERSTASNVHQLGTFVNGRQTAPVNSNYSGALIKLYVQRQILLCRFDAKINGGRMCSVPGVLIARVLRQCSYVAHVIGL
jgi:hypothetical protein